ncbi:Lhr-like helicases [hydrothermal vent metagenome]|uniref:Lhr-like helicases n=1 Tax=hydrothermal vent metagenome TaxID=652676 RepID=A0A1W1CID2_9ZZZZ
MHEPIEIQLLNKLEEIEYKSIQWGYVDGSLDEDLVYDLADELEDEDLVDKLLDEKLLFEVEGGFRTRFGETVRLLTNLKQIFPNRSWQESPRLVSDFRIKLQKRFYPIRDIDPLELLSKEPFSKLTILQKEVWNRLLTLYPNMKLAKFQERATSILLEKIMPYRALIVTAGTGSGKTLSFYLPALLRVVDSIQKDKNHWTRVLCAYPRVELLRDQLTEAMAQILAIEDKGIRPIKIGALYGAIPTNCSFKSIQVKKWKRNREDTGWICPILNCPKTDIDLIWLDSDIEKGVERLVPSEDIDGAVTLESKHIVLTRESLLKESPDFLFITLEMLNKRLSDFRIKKLFGIGKLKTERPFLMLLDEVHTYTGTTGTQSAFVLRRWKQALNADVTFVGLSATLSSAERFFSELTGIYQNRVIEITPQVEEIIEKGTEYQIVLKGDPINRTGLLSTTIQTIMLMGRVVEPINKKSAYYGQKVFAFTDDLDVTNRLFDDLKDAEGWDIFNRNDPTKASLAKLREKDIANEDRYRDGQDWRVLQEIGHNLSELSADAKLKISRTSSQDIGVDGSSSVIVATASLEVGFNDPTVGVVVQHKSPHNWANFLQRKGRAGRKRGMRPFMITILSDFGRDRVSFSHYEQFFEPIVSAERLPISNRYILKIQATITLFDWLSKKISSRNIWMFKILSQPVHTNNKQSIDEIIILLEKILMIDSKENREFVIYLKYALGGVSDRDVSTILWSFPRSLMLEVIPTLLRRIKSNYKLAFPKDEIVYENYIERLPLPEFITATLFSDLALPEVDIIVPLDQDKKEYHSMALIQAMREFAPGRISRRFATIRGNLFHWIPIDTELTEQQLELGDYSSKVDAVTSVIHQGQNIEIFRPWEYKLVKNSDPKISKRSNSTLVWSVKFRVEGSPIDINIAKGDGWSDKIDSFGFYLNAHNSSVESIRYTTKAITHLSFTDGTTLETRINFVHNQKSVGIGFSMSGDGICIRYKVPTLKELKNQQIPKELQRELRIAWYKSLVLDSQQLPKSINLFDREKLQEILLNSIVVVSKDREVDLKEANRILNNDSSILFEVLEKLYAPNSKLYNTLYKLLEIKEIRVELHSIFDKAMLVDNNWWRWIRETLHHSFAESILVASQKLTPNQSAIDTLLVDTIPLSDSDNIGVIWLTESSAGGVGVLDALIHIVSANPAKFFQAIDTSTQPSDYEQVIDSLEYFLSLVQSDVLIKELALEICEIKEHKQRQESLSRLYKKLSKEGIIISHAFKIALNTRLLKEGVDENFLMLIDEIIVWGKRLEEQKNIAIDSKTLSFLLLKENLFQERISNLIITQGNKEIDSVNFLSNILWVRSFEARWQLLQSYSPFKSYNIFTDPQIVRLFMLKENIAIIKMESENWREKISSSLARGGICKLQTSNEKTLRSNLVEILAKPIDVGFLQLFVVITGVQRERKDFIVTLKLREEW